MTKIAFYCFTTLYAKSPFFTPQKRYERNADSTFRLLLDYISLCHICSQVRCNTHRHTQLHEFFALDREGGRLRRLEWLERLEIVNFLAKFPNLPKLIKLSNRVA